MAIEQEIYEKLVEAISYIENEAQNQELHEIEAYASSLRELIEELNYIPTY